MNNEMITECLKMEGQRFKLLLKMDKTTSIYDYGYLKAEVEKLTTRIEQYQSVIATFRNRPRTRKK